MYAIFLKIFHTSLLIEDAVQIHHGENNHAKHTA
jgi:hypothetical protein